MGSWLDFTLVTLCVVAFLAIVVQWRGSRRRKWDRVARRLRLRLEHEEPGGWCLRGRRGAREVHVRGQPSGRSRVALAADYNELGEIAFHRDHAPGRRVLTGDADFDRAVRIGGDEVRALAVLDASTRGALAEAVAGGVSLGYGLIELVLPGQPPTAEAIDSALDQLEQLVDLLASEPDDLGRRLASHAVTDPVVGVRRQCLRILQREFGSSPDAAATAELLRDDPDPEIQQLLSAPP